MSVLTIILLAAATGSISVQVEGEASEVVAYRDGELLARGPVTDGRALLAELSDGAYDLRAIGPACASDFVSGVRAVAGSGEGFDARLVCRPAHAVTIRTEPGAGFWVGGVRLTGPELLLPEGLHRLVVDHPRFVSSEARLLRVAGPMEVFVPLQVGLVVTGRVVDPKGKPVAGARVAAFAGGYAANRQALTDESGAFGLSGFRGAVISVETSAAGFARHLRRVEFFPGEQRARVELQLEPASAVSIPVEEADAVLLPAWYERALEEPRLRAHHTPARASGSGLVRFDHLTPGREYRILLSAPSFRPAATSTFKAPPAGETLELPRISLRPAAQVECRLEPVGIDRISGHWVHCRGTGNDQRQRTDRAGRVRFEDLDPGSHLFWTPDLESEPVKISLEAGDNPLVTLSAGRGSPDCALAGQVSDADGEPLEGVEVRAAGRRAVTDSEGRYRIDRMPRAVSLWHTEYRPGPGCRGLVADPHLPYVQPMGTRPGVNPFIRLERAGELRLEFTDLPAPLSRATLHLASTSGHRRTVRLPRGAREVTVPDLPVGPYVADLEAPGILGTSGRIVKARPATAKAEKLRVVAGRRIAGRLVLWTTVLRPDGLPETRETPLTSGRVTLFDPDPLRAMASTPVEEDGSFLLEGLPLGPLLLVGHAPGLPVTAAVFDLTSRSVNDAVIALQPAARAQLKVTDPDGLPLGDLRVRIRHEAGPELWDLVAVGRFRQVVADEREFGPLRHLFKVDHSSAGLVQFPYLCPGSYRFQVEAEGFKAAEIGVRARMPWTLNHLRRLFPYLIGETIAHLRLDPLEPDPIDPDSKD